MNEPVTTIVGNLTGDPEMRFTPSGAAVCKFRVASTPRTRDGDQWKDGTPLFMTVTVWEKLAEHVSETLKKGHQVIVQGSLKQRDWEDDNGGKRSAIEMTAFAVGPNLQFATAVVTKKTSSGGIKGDDDWAKASRTPPPANGQPAAAAQTGPSAETQRAAQAVTPDDEPPPW